MDLTSIEIDQLASKVNDFCFDANTIQSLGLVVKSTEMSQKFVEALIAKQSLLEQKPEAAVERTQRILEKLAEKSKLFASIFMAHLYSTADELGMVDLWDYIDLWIVHNKSPELKNYLLMLARSQVDEDLRLHYEQIAEVE